MTGADQTLYQQIILDHAKARHGASTEPLKPLDGPITRAGSIRIAEAHQVNPTCGDESTVRVSIHEEASPARAQVQELVWWGEGCTISMAAASVLSDTVHGKSVPEAQALVAAYRAMLHSRGTADPDEETLGDAAAFVGVSRYPARVKCAMLPWVAFEVALINSGYR